MTATKLLPAHFSLHLLGSICRAEESQFLLRETFDNADLPNTRMNGAGVPGKRYQGHHYWTTGSEGPAGKHETSFQVGKGLGWSAVEAENAVLLVDSTGSVENNDSALFRVADWNHAGAEVVDISFSMALDPGDQKSRWWGAVILSAHAWKADLPEVGPGARDQHLRLWFHTDGHLGHSPNGKLAANVLKIGPDQRNEVRILFNGSAGDREGLRPGRAHVWVNGKRVVENADLGPKPAEAPGSTVLNYFEIRPFGALNLEKGAPLQAWFDNIAVTAARSASGVRP